MNSLHINELNKSHLKRLIIWSHSHQKHAIYYAQPLLYIFYSNVPILNDKGEKLEFTKYEEAEKCFSEIIQSLK